MTLGAQAPERSVRLQNLAGTGNPIGTYYFPFAQNTPRNYSFAVRTHQATTGIAQALCNAVAQVDPALALFDVKTMAERTELSIASRKAAMSLAVGFGGVALFLSGVGVYGVLSYLLAQRRREIGIRIALGSTPTGIFRLFLREGIVLVSSGLVPGLAGAAAMRRALENQDLRCSSARSNCALRSGYGPSNRSALRHVYGLPVRPQESIR